ncbi:hypothetical protein PUMCH_002631 [Australozyma saopauloensis]|uniref:ATP-dependent RNA helicase n=1 Tax=Australozyma saopauloensis TaxID=291208 RepID=A0AAX4HC12_9ASCO|nr:hypothetical protein PUMCH_002631 [[Candida] saopauloensis]
MDDDGLIMNFAIPDGTQTFKKTAPKAGGLSWRERRAKFKLGEGAGPKSGVNSIAVAKRAPRENKGNFNKPNRDGQSKDKQNSEGSSGSQKRSHPEELAESKKLKFTEKSGEKGGINNTYVSSLFTAQTKGPTLEETTAESVSHQPSNAPLKDDSTFEGLGLTEKLSQHLTSSMKYVAPTKVQRAVISKMIDSQQDYFVKAQTGSGKTLAFVLPIIHRLMTEPDLITRLSGLFAVILTPTRELAVQIHAVLESILRCHHHIVPGVVVGGEKKKSEKARIRKGVNILVATPGRLADHLENTTSLDVSQVRWLVLDEGDRLVELGFQETITKITDHLSQHSRINSNKWIELPPRRVNILCSATMPDDVKQFGSTILEKPEMISIDRGSEINATAPDQLVLKVLTVPPKLRLVTLAACLKNVPLHSEEVSRSIVFLSCANSVDYHFDVFAHGGKTTLLKDVEENEDEEGDEKNKKPTKPEIVYSTAPQINSNSVVFRLHGSLSQQLRSATILAFISNAAANSNKHFVLLCTDVASRGLDMPNISNVVEYDPPFTVDDHLHRIGRSARLGKAGEATIFLLPGEEEGYVDGKLRVVHPKKGSLRIVKYETILENAFSQEDAPDNKTGKKDPKAKAGKWDMHATTWHLEVERWLLENTAALEKASNAFVSHVRAYATHIGLEKMYFNVKTLHLGHLAKAFGLRETPKKLGSKSGENEGKKKEDPRKKMLRLARLAEKSKASEFNY